MTVANLDEDADQPYSCKLVTVRGVWTEANAVLFKARRKWARNRAMICGLTLRSSWCGGSAYPPAGTHLLSNFLEPAKLLSRVRVAEGIRKADISEADGGVPYRSGALVPLNSWRNVTHSDLARFADQPRWRNTASFLALLSLSRRFILNCLSNLERVGNSSKRSADLIADVERELLPDFQRFGDVVVSGIATNRPGLSTVTIDRRDRRRIGLHIDSWYGGSIEQRDTAPNRISINLGCSSRYLLFMASTVGHVYNYFNTSQTSGDIVRELMAITDTLARTVYCLEVKPGEAYVAPTEAIVHDGSTMWSESADRSATLRSTFLPDWTMIDWLVEQSRL